MPEKITDKYKGDFDKIKNRLNHLIDEINGLTGEMAMMADAAVEGKTAAPKQNVKKVAKPEADS